MKPLSSSNIKGHKNRNNYHRETYVLLLSPDLLLFDLEQRETV